MRSPWSYRFLLCLVSILFVHFSETLAAGESDSADEVRAIVRAKYDQMPYQLDHGYPSCHDVLTRWSQERLEIFNALNEEGGGLQPTASLDQKIIDVANAARRSKELSDGMRTVRYNRGTGLDSPGVCFDGKATVVTLGRVVYKQGAEPSDITYKIVKQEVPLEQLADAFATGNYDEYQLVLSSTVDHTTSPRYQLDCWSPLDSVFVGRIDGGDSFNLLRIESPVSGDTLLLTVTSGHRFMALDDKRQLHWKPAASLANGDRLYSGAECRTDKDGNEVCENLVVTEFDQPWYRFDEPDDGFPVYNLSVGTTSSYYVGSETNRVLVHNDY